MVNKMAETAADTPDEAIAFQGAGRAPIRILRQWNMLRNVCRCPCFSFEDALDAVKIGTAGCAIIPIENSLHGRVADIHFLLPESGLHIVAEHFMPIQHCLMAKSADAKIETALSHPQALGQCRHYLREKAIVSHGLCRHCRCRRFCRAKR